MGQATISANFWLFPSPGTLDTKFGLDHSMSNMWSNLYQEYFAKGSGGRRWVGSGVNQS